MGERGLKEMKEYDANYYYGKCKLAPQRELRNVTLICRITESEYAMLRNKAKALNMSQPNLIVQAVEKF